jgi:hypothetical protein
VRSTAATLLPVKGGSISTLEDEIVDQPAAKTVLNALLREYAAAR